MSPEQSAALLKAGDATLEKRLQKMESSLAPKEAEAAFSRAETYAKANAAQHLLIAIRFFEVASRAKGQELSLKAQDRSLQELQLWLKNLDLAEADAKAAVAPPAAEKKSEALPSAAKPVPVLAAAQQKEAEKTIKEVL